MPDVWSGKFPVAAESGPGREAGPQVEEVILAADARPRMGTGEGRPVGDVGGHWPHCPAQSWRSINVACTAE